MNITNKTIILAGLLINFSTACKNDINLPEPAAGSARQAALNGNIQPGSGKKYTLMSEGAMILHRYLGGGLMEESPFVNYCWYDSNISKDNANLKSGLPTLYRTYDVKTAGNSLRSGDFLVNIDDSGHDTGGQIRSSYLYKDAKGRCYKMDEKLTPLSSPETDRTYLYTYNDQDQLVQRVNAANQAEKAIYSYNAHGDLIQVDYFNDESGIGANPNLGGVLVERIQLSYDPVASGSGKVLDLSHLNPEFDPKLDRYLPIYGTFGKYLVHRITILHPSAQYSKQLVKFSDQYFSYILNDDGYVTQRQRFTMSGSTLLATDAYTYKIDKLGLNP